VSATNRREPSELLARLEGEENVAAVPVPSAKIEDPRVPAKVVTVYSSVCE
jgi:hypothetical protein